MVICDAVWVDPNTGKATILGTFAALSAREFPVVSNKFAVYTALTDIHGSIGLRLDLVDADELEPVVLAETEVGDLTPVEVVEAVFELDSVEFPR